jgi:hypothetical protein
LANKVSIRAKFERPFCWFKGILGYNKVRNRGLANNRNRLCLCIAFANLLVGKEYMQA